MGGEKLLVKNRELIISSQSPASNVGVWTQIPDPCIPPGLSQGIPGHRSHQLGQGTPWGDRDASTQHPEARTATLCELITRLGGVGSTNPAPQLGLGQGSWGAGGGTQHGDGGHSRWEPPGFSVTLLSQQRHV